MDEIKRGFILFLLISFLTGILYPSFIMGVAQSCFKEKANGSLIKKDSKILGSKLIGQAFTSQQYFHGRPSFVDYKGSISGATNLGPTNYKLIQNVKKEIEKVRAENNLSLDANIPSDLILSSASGLDPHISIESALLQVPRIARARNINEEKVHRLVNKYKESRQLHILGEPRINVLVLNLALDDLVLAQE